jgi:protein-S-isoprenylcysteine O-methyltransferase Ste14
MIPGTIVFLVLSPFFLFFVARYISGFIPLTWPRSFELCVFIGAFSVAAVLMLWSFYVLWFHGKGTPAPIAPTRYLVTTGPFRFCRNPIELGTDLYFLGLGIWFDSLTTGIFCMIFGLLLGSGYIKLIEEHELKSRFGSSYEKYFQQTPFMIPFFRFIKKNR